MRAVFLGTPEAAVPSLRTLAGIAHVRAVFTQPDRPKGRSGQPVATPVKSAAQSLGLEVIQPATSVDLTRELRAMGEIDVAVIVAYGMLIRAEALEIPRCGFVNVHFSVLPRWRGAAPVQRAIEAGDPRIGVTLMQLDAGLDTGPILSTRSTALSPTETAADVLGRLAADGADLLESQLSQVVSGSVVALPQNESEATHAPKVSGRDRPLDISATQMAVRGKVQALSPNPGATLTIDGLAYKILGAVTSEAPRDPADALRLESGRLLLTVGDGVVEILSIQPPGKRPMSGADWARGRHGTLGVVS